MNVLRLVCGLQKSCISIPELRKSRYTTTMSSGGEAGSFFISLFPHCPVPSFSGSLVFCSLFLRFPLSPVSSFPCSPVPLFRSTLFPGFPFPILKIALFFNKFFYNFFYNMAVVAVSAISKFGSIKAEEPRFSCILSSVSR